MTTISNLARSNAVALVLLVLANLLPLAGVLWWGWRLSDLVILYWLESGVIGAYTVAKMAMVYTAGPERLVRLVLKLFCVPFFIGHYGVFWLVHGVFILFFFTDLDIMATTGPGQALEAILAEAGQRMQFLVWPFIGIVISHGAAFFSNFVENYEERQALAIQFMFQPYGRVVVLHITIIASAFLMLRIGVTPLLLVVFIVVKTVADALAHQWEHRTTVRRLLKFQAESSEGAPV